MGRKDGGKDMINFSFRKPFSFWFTGDDDMFRPEPISIRSAGGGNFHENYLDYINNIERVKYFKIYSSSCINCLGESQCFEEEIINIRLQVTDSCDES